jgi:hypothetical protein
MDKKIIKALKVSLIFMASAAIWKYVVSIEAIAPYFKFIQRVAIGVLPTILFYDIYRVHRMALQAIHEGRELPQNLENRYGPNITRQSPESLQHVARMSLAIVMVWVIFICWYAYTNLSLS